MISEADRKFHDRMHRETEARKKRNYEAWKLIVDNEKLAATAFAEANPTPRKIGAGPEACILRIKL